MMLSKNNFLLLLVHFLVCAVNMKNLSSRIFIFSIFHVIKSNILRSYSASISKSREIFQTVHITGQGRIIET